MPPMSGAKPWLIRTHHTGLQQECTVTNRCITGTDRDKLCPKLVLVRSIAGNIWTHLNPWRIAPVRPCLPATNCGDAPGRTPGQCERGFTYLTVYTCRPSAWSFICTHWKMPFNQPYIISKLSINLSSMNYYHYYYYSWTALRRTSLRRIIH